MKTILILFLLCGMTSAQTLPDKPQPQKAFWPMIAASGVATIADVETQQGALRRGCREVNPLYGSQPSRVRAYAVAGGMTAGITVLAYWLRKKAPNSKIWMVPVISNIGWHGLGAAVNANCR